MQTDMTKQMKPSRSQGVPMPEEKRKTDAELVLSLQIKCRLS